MTESERVFDAFRNCVTIPKCRDCPWAECEELNNEKIEMPKDLALAVLRELATQGQNESESEMTGNEYQHLAQRTANPKLNDSGKLQNGVMGLCGESGECVDLMKKVLFQGHKFEMVRGKLVEELGDVCWYVAETASALGVDLEDVMRRNIEKLKARYPEGFSAERSINRSGENDNG